MIPAATLPVEAPEDVLFDTPLARLAIGSAGAVDRLITRTQGQMALGVRLGGSSAPMPVFRWILLDSTWGTARGCIRCAR